MKRFFCLLTLLFAACLAFGDTAITVPITQPNGTPAINPALALKLVNYPSTYTVGGLAIRGFSLSTAAPPPNRVAAAAHGSRRCNL